MLLEFMHHILNLCNEYHVCATITHKNHLSDIKQLPTFEKGQLS